MTPNARNLETCQINLCSLLSHQLRFLFVLIWAVLSMPQNSLALNPPPSLVPEKIPFIIRSHALHQVKIINEGSTAFNQLIELIEGAKKTIDAEYFIFQSDLGGRLILQALLKKAKQGVKVRLLLDHSHLFVRIHDDFGFYLTQRGIDVRYYNHARALSPRDLLWRNHRKLMITDRNQVMLGGRNIGDEYFDQSSKHNFLDRDVLLSGPIVATIAQSFDYFWNSPETSRPKIKSSFGVTFGLIPYGSKLVSFHKFLAEDKETRARAITHKLIGGKIHRHLPIYRCNDVLFVSDDPEIPKAPNVEITFIKLLKSSQQKIIIETPYFILKKGGQKELINFTRGGGAFIMLTNGFYSTDVGLALASFMDHVREPLKFGAEIFIYGGSPPPYPMISTAAMQTIWGIHAKTAVFDNRHTMIGSFNLDPRSAQLNNELALFCLNQQELAAAVTESILGRIKQAGQLDQDGQPMDRRYPYLKLTVIEKLGLWLYSPWSPFFEQFL